MTTPIVVLGCGRAHPDGQLTNADLEERLDTTDQWIRERTGICSRWIGGSTTEWSTTAARIALAHADVTPAELGVIVVATSTPDQRLPSTAAMVARDLGSDAGGFDVNGACAGYVYALGAAAGWVELTGRPALVIGTDVMSRIIDPNDRNTAILFGDGAGALVIGPTGDTDSALLSLHSGTDGTTVDILRCEAEGFLTMQGPAVFKVAVRAAVESIKAALDQAGLDASEADLLVPHQANERITTAIAQRLELSADRVVSTLAETGNTSAGSIPYSLSVACDDGRLRRGQIVRPGRMLTMVEGVDGRVALVTGATRGLGLAIARRLAAEGHRVIGTFRHSHPDVDGVSWVMCDVTDRVSVDAAFNEIEATIGPVEILIANAGTTRDGLALRMSDDDFASVIETNLVGSFRCARRAAAKMVRGRWGRIIFISSVVAQMGQAGIEGMSRSLARELASRNICVNVVAPGPLPTDMLEALTDERRASIASAVPLGRLGTLGEVSAAVAFLAGDEAGYITGVTLGVDGGLGI